MTLQPSLGAEGHSTDLIADGSVIDVGEEQNSCRRYFTRAANNPSVLTIMEKALTSTTVLMVGDIRGTYWR